MAASGNPILPISELEAMLDCNEAMFSQHKTRTRSDSTKARQEQSIATLKNDQSVASAWFDLASTLRHEDSITVEPLNIVATQRSCLLRALELDSKHAGAWSAVGALLLATGGTDARVRIDSIGEVSAQQAFLRALELDAGLALAWNGLGATLLKTTDRIVVTSVSVTKRDCYIRALEINPVDAVAMCNLGIMMNEDETVKVAGIDQPLTRRYCFLKALEGNQHSAVTWHNLGNTLTHDECVYVQTVGAAVTRRDCFLRAVELNPKRSKSWSSLGTTFTTEKETVFVGAVGADISERDCYLRAVELNPHHPSFWNNLGTTLRSKDRATAKDSTGSVVVSNRDCFIRALELEPHHKDAWRNLGRSLGMFETAQIPKLGLKVNSKECKKRAEALVSPSKAAR